MQIMTTNGGVHSADKWAEATANEIMALISIPDEANSGEALMARKTKRDVQPVLIDAIATIYDNCQKAERSVLKSQGKKRLAAPYDIEATADAGVQVVTAIMSSTMFAAHFATPDVQETVEHIFGQHSTDILHIERSHFITSKKET